MVERLNIGVWGDCANYAGVHRHSLYIFFCMHSGGVSNLQYIENMLFDMRALLKKLVIKLIL